MCGCACVAARVCGYVGADGWVRRGSHDLSAPTSGMSVVDEVILTLSKKLNNLEGRQELKINMLDYFVINITKILQNVWKISTYIYRAILWEKKLR